MYDLTFSMRDLYGPGAVERVGVKIGEARRQNCPGFTKDIASAKGCKETARDKTQEREIR